MHGFEFGIDSVSIRVFIRALAFFGKLGGSISVAVLPAEAADDVRELRLSSIDTTNSFTTSLVLRRSFFHDSRALNRDVLEVLVDSKALSRCCKGLNYLKISHLRLFVSSDYLALQVAWIPGIYSLRRLQCAIQPSDITPSPADSPIGVLHVLLSFSPRYFFDLLNLIPENTAASVITLQWSMAAEDDLEHHLSISNCCMEADVQSPSTVAVKLSQRELKQNGSYIHCPYFPADQPLILPNRELRLLSSFVVEAGQRSDFLISISRSSYSTGTLRHEQWLTLRGAPRSGERVSAECSFSIELRVKRALSAITILGDNRPRQDDSTPA
jgi:hypothetical protein